MGFSYLFAACCLNFQDVVFEDCTEEEVKQSTTSAMFVQERRHQEAWIEMSSKTALEMGQSYCIHYWCTFTFIIRAKRKWWGLLWSNSVYILWNPQNHFCKNREKFSNVLSGLLKHPGDQLDLLRFYSSSTSCTRCCHVPVLWNVSASTGFPISNSLRWSRNPIQILFHIQFFTSIGNYMLIILYF